MQKNITIFGFCDRFRSVGFDEPKTLIKSNEKPLFADSIQISLEEQDLIFICKQDYLSSADYRKEEPI